MSVDSTEPAPGAPDPAAATPDYGPDVARHHAALLAASAIPPGVAAARGYRSVWTPGELAALGFAPAQCRVPGLLIPIHDVDGRVALHQFRPDQPRHHADGKAIKYETPQGARMVLDVPPAARAALGDPHTPLWITEGARKADAAVGAGLCCIALLGVWNFRGTNAAGGRTALPDWETVALNDRAVVVAFDSDVMTKPAVQAALDRFGAFLARRGARVSRVLLPGGPLGAKVGLDDFLAAGHAVADVLALRQPDPAGDPRGREREMGNRERGGRVPVAAVLLDIAAAEGLTVFHTPAQEAYAVVDRGTHRETWPLNSRGFRQWLGACAFASRALTPTGRAFEDATAVLAARALHSGPEEPVYLRVGVQGEALYLDLGDPEWRAVAITAQGWQVLARPPVHFYRPRSAGALPLPARGGTLAELWPFVNASDPGSRALVAAFLTAALRPQGPYPLLLLAGEQGSAKSTLARLLRRLVDPTASPLRAEPRNLEDLMIAARHNWVLSFDNLSTLRPWLSDALCRLSTGGGFGTRALYSDHEEAIIDAQRPVILTSIEEIATRGDLLERALVLELDPIPPEGRRQERELWAAFDAAAPRILAGLLDGVVHALATAGTLALPPLPRMADFAAWALAAEPAWGLPPGQFLAAYMGQLHDSHRLLLEATPLALPLVLLAGAQPERRWEGSATELLQALAPHTPDALRRRRDWPQDARTLGGLLKRIAPALRTLGFTIEQRREARTGRRRVCIARTDTPAPPAGPPPPVAPPAAPLPPTPYFAEDAPLSRTLLAELSRLLDDAGQRCPTCGGTTCGWPLRDCAA